MGVGVAVGTGVAVSVGLGVGVGVSLAKIWNMPPLPNGLGRFFTLRGEYYLLGEDGSVKKKGETTKEGSGNANEDGA